MDYKILAEMLADILRLAPYGSPHKNSKATLATYLCAKKFSESRPSQS